MYIPYNFINQPVPPHMYIANPNNKIIHSLLGVSSARLNIHLRDIWSIDFEIDKYISYVENYTYEYIRHSREIFVDNIGWFRINSHPTEECSTDGRWYKTFTAYGYETTLQDLDIIGININCGTEDSVEMYEENLDVFGIPKNNIRLYIKNANDDPTSSEYWKLGLLNILEHEYLYQKGWKIGSIDDSVASLRGRQFEIDNQNVYSFLTQDVASAFKCMFVFDRINKTIDAIKLDKFGQDMNLVFTLRNVINSITIKDQNDEYYTRFRVAGNNPDSALIEYINYGSDRLENLSYCIQSGMLDDSIVQKYNTYKEFVDTHRQEYADYSRTLMKLQEEKTVYQELLPIDEVDMLFTNVSDEELSTELEHFKNILKTLENIYGSASNIEGTTDYSMYVSVRDVIIPKIEAEIAARKNGTHAAEDAVDYETNWELYGINELQIKLAAYDRQVDVLKEGKYDKPWTATAGGTESYHNKQYELYVKYSGYITDINTRLTELYALVADIDNAISDNNTKQKALASRAKLEADEWNFTQEELQDIYILYRDTDFTDKTIEILDTDSIDNIIQLAWQLYESASEQIEIESHPQLTYSISLDNLFHIAGLSHKANNINLGDFCYLELDKGFTTKQRIISMEFELVNFNQTDFQIEFSDMTTVCGKADDYRFLLESGTSSGKGQITRQQAKYISNEVNSAALQILNKYYISNTDGRIFPNGVNPQDVEELQGALNGLVEGFIKEDNLRGEVSNLDSLEYGSVFLKYLDTQLNTSENTVEHLTTLSNSQLNTLFNNNPFANQLSDIISTAIDNYNDNIIKTFLDRSHPVGSIYFTDNSGNPSLYLGGTWETWGSGCIPIGVDADDETGTLNTPNQIIEESLVLADEPMDEETGTVIKQRKITCYMWKRTA